MQRHARDYLCLALDVPDTESGKRLAGGVIEYVGLFKIGLQLFTSQGPRVVEEVKKLGANVFLDLKFHDIPNTVAEAVRSAAGLGVDLLNVHAAGGEEMLRAAAKAAREAAGRDQRRARVLGVTVLTSIDEAVLGSQVGVSEPLESYVVRLASMCVDAGLDGVIASAQELVRLRSVLGKEPVIVTPGIRPPGSPADDQKRTLTPHEAIKAGATYIVVGRPIRKSPNPGQAAKDICGDISRALEPAQ